MVTHMDQGEIDQVFLVRHITAVNMMEFGLQGRKGRVAVDLTGRMSAVSDRKWKKAMGEGLEAVCSLGSRRKGCRKRGADVKFRCTGG